VDDVASLVEGEADLRRARATKSRSRLARFRGMKTLEPFRWDWPTRITRLQGQKHFPRELITAQAHRIFLGGGGVGKTHLAPALGSTACLKGYSVLCASAIAVIHTLAAARSAGRLKQALQAYTKPALLLLDARGDVPIDKGGADLLFQVLSLRDEPGAILIPSNRAFKEWPPICNHASPRTAALLDRLLHHAETVILEGKRFRMQDPRESCTSLWQGSPDARLLTPAISSLTLPIVPFQTADSSTRLSPFQTAASPTFSRNR
jgi:DNA replication protein DnaC